MRTQTSRMKLSFLHVDYASKTFPFKHVIKCLVDFWEWDFVGDELFQLKFLQHCGVSNSIDVCINKTSVALNNIKLEKEHQWKLASALASLHYSCTSPQQRECRFEACNFRRRYPWESSRSESSRDASWRRPLCVVLPQEQQHPNPGIEFCVHHNKITSKLWKRETWSQRIRNIHHGHIQMQISWLQHFQYIQCFCPLLHWSAQQSPNKQSIRKAL